MIDYKLVGRDPQYMQHQDHKTNLYYIYREDNLHGNSSFQKHILQIYRLKYIYLQNIFHLENNCIFIRMVFLDKLPLCIHIDSSI